LALAKNINKNGFDNLLHAIEQSTYKLKQNQLWKISDSTYLNDSEAYNLTWYKLS